MSSKFLVFIYYIHLFVFFGFISWYYFWIMMEYNLMIFLLVFYIMGIEKGFYLGEVMFNYFYIQILGSIMFLFFYLMFFMEDLFFVFDYSFFFVVVLLSLLLKLGGVPFHGWVYYFSSKLSSKVFLIFLTFQKIPLFFCLLVYTDFFLMFMLSISMAFGSFFVFISSDLVMLMVSSSIMSIFYFYLMLVSSLEYFLLFFLFYYFISLVLISMLFSSLYYFMDGWEKCMILFIGFFFVSGLPPFSIFFMKMNMVVVMLESFSLIYLISVSLFMFLSFIGYMRFFYTFFFFFKSFYVLKFDNKIFFFYFFLMFPLLMMWDYKLN